MTTLFYLVPVAAVIALLFAWIFFRQMMKESEGTPTMKEIAQYGPMALAYRTPGCRLPSSRAAFSAAWPASWA